MNRNHSLLQLQTTTQWDIIIIGGGATGLGIAIDAANRGYKTLLVEQYDFAKGTSSKATKLVHGGVRYMAQGNIKLVREALKERALLLQNAPQVCHTQNFIIPCYSYWQLLKYGIGLKIYDLLSGKYSLGKTIILKRNTVVQALQNFDKKIKGGVAYKDGQFDDARLVIDIAQTATNKGAVLINYTKVIGLQKKDELVTAVLVEDTLQQKKYTLQSSVVVNATGVFVDSILQYHTTTKKPLVKPSQGVHIVVAKHFLPTANALMVPKTKDGRVLFAIPWQQSVVIGTTDTPISTISIEPKALPEEVAFIITHFNAYTKQQLQLSDVKAVFVGLRPLVKQQGLQSTAALSRDHTILQHHNLWTITGGKWTTYRKMAEDILQKIINAKQLPYVACSTHQLAIPSINQTQLKSIAQENAEYTIPLVEYLPYTKAHIIYSIRYEMAVTVEDVLARRMRILFINATKAIQLAPMVAKLLAIELQQDDTWQQAQIKQFTQLVKQHYSLPYNI